MFRGNVVTAADHRLLSVTCIVSALPLLPLPGVQGRPLQQVSAGGLRRLIVNGRQDRHAFSAAAGISLIRISKHKFLVEHGGLVIDDRPEQKQNSFCIDHDFDAIIFNDLVQICWLFNIVHDVFHACTSAIRHADTQIACSLVGHDLLNAPGGGVCKLDELWTWSSGHTVYVMPVVSDFN